MRELREEIGIEITTLPNVPFCVIDDDGFRMIVWNVTSWTGTAVNKAPGEHDDLRWVTFDELQGLHLAHPSYHDLFRAILP